MAPVKKDPFMTVVELMKYANNNLGVNIKIRTTRNILLHAGLPGRKPAKKPWISKNNRSARLKFTKDHKDWTVEQWKRIFYSDETKNNLFGYDGIKYVRRPAHT
uniref:Transposase Tc1-like domain-containing protein n=1 Tax=Acrobeloides nanus TaxID=290746 RepID=A0A914CY64_9BILA